MNTTLGHTARTARDRLYQAYGYADDAFNIAITTGGALDTHTQDLDEALTHIEQAIELLTKTITRDAQPNTQKGDLPT